MQDEKHSKNSHKSAIWIQVKNDSYSFSARTGHCCVSFGNSFYLFGGVDGNTLKNDMLSFDINDEQWKIISDDKGSVPEPCSGMQAISLESSVLFYGGYTKKFETYQNGSYIFDPVHLRWKKEEMLNPPPPRIDFSFVKAGSTPYCIQFGGSDGYRFLNDMYILDIEKKIWTFINIQNTNNGNTQKNVNEKMSDPKNLEKVPCPRFGHSGVSFNDKMYLFGGWDGKATLNDQWSFEWKTLNWIKLSSYTDVAPRYRHSAVVFNNFMVIFGGVDHYQIRFNDIHLLNFMDLSWRRVLLDNTGPSPRTFHKAIEHNSDMFIIGGFDGGKLNDIWKINLNDLCYNSWNNPSKKNKSTVKITEKNIPDEKTQPENHYLYNLLKPLSNYEWKEIVYDTKKGSSKSIPGCRTGHNVVFFNGKLYIIGGMDVNSEMISLSSLNIFNTINGTWTIESTKGSIPEARSGMQRSKGQSDTLDYEVGRYVNFFGGYSSKNTILKDFYTLDFDELKWYKLIIDNFDSSDFKSRLDFSINEDEGEYLIFGGRDMSLIFGDLWKLRKNELGKYILEKIECGGIMPDKRFGHGAYKHKRHIFLFGGWNGNKCLDDFYEYSCETQLWYEIKQSTGDNPSPRYRFDGDIFNNKLYIFGGVTAKQIRFNDVYEFEILTREWSKVQCKKTYPTPRSFHTQTLNENCMIVFGGLDGTRKNDQHVLNLSTNDNKFHNFSTNMILPLRKEREPQTFFNKSGNQIQKKQPQSEKIISYNSQKSSVLTELSSKKNINKPEFESPNQLDNNDDQGQSQKQLIEYYKLLNEQVIELSGRLKLEQQTKQCRICFSRAIDSVFLECFHCVSCFQCGKNLPKCIICKATINRVIKTYSNSQSYHHVQTLCKLCHGN